MGTEYNTREKDTYGDLRAKVSPSSWKGRFLEGAQENACSVPLSLFLHNTA